MSCMLELYASDISKKSSTRSMLLTTFALDPHSGHLTSASGSSTVISNW